MIFFCYHLGGSTEVEKMKRRSEESSPSDTSTPKKRKSRLAGGIRTYLLACPLTLTPPNPIFFPLSFVKYKCVDPGKWYE